MPEYIAFPCPCGECDGWLVMPAGEPFMRLDEKQANAVANMLNNPQLVNQLARMSDGKGILGC